MKLLKHMNIGVIVLSVAGSCAFAQAPSDKEEFVLEEIMVTARKRGESLQDVPMAVSAVGGAELAQGGIDNVEGLYGRIPGLHFSQGVGIGLTSDFLYITLRGIGFNGGLEPATAIFVDGMYQPQLSADISFLDLERVEVLRGPQGTLFGRNTQAGALSLVTRAPDEEFRGKIEAEVAEFGTFRTTALVSGGLSDTLFGGISAEVKETDGYMDNVTLGEDHNFSEQFSVRGQLRWTPTDELDLRFIANMSRKDFHEIGYGAPVDCDCYDSIADFSQDDYKDQNGAQLNIAWDINDSMQLNSITGWQEVESSSSFDPDASPTGQTPLTLSAVTETSGTPSEPINVANSPITVAGTSHVNGIEQEFFSQELRLSGETERLDWLGGLYYFKQEMLQPRALDIGPDADFAALYVREAFTEDRDGWAVFGQMIFRPTDQLELTLGGRQTEETTEPGGARVLNVGDFFVNAFTKSGSETFSDFTPMASASYDITDEALVYLTYAEGWKAGGFNRYPGRGNSNISYESEQSKNLEAGMKASFLDGRADLNLAIFTVDIKDQQLGVVVPDPAGGPTPVAAVANAGASTSEGVEMELIAQVTENLNATLSYAYTKAEFDEFIESTPTDSLDRAGEQFPYVPKTTGSLSLSYDRDLSSTLALNLYANYRYVGKYSTPDISFVAPLGSHVDVPSYDRLDLRASLAFSNWEVALYVDNALDSLDYRNISRHSYAPADDSEPLFGEPLSPRQVGLVVSMTF